MTLTHQPLTVLEAALDELRRSPCDDGTLALVVRRPAEREREVLAEGRPGPVPGLVGDAWSTRGSRRTADGSPD